MLQPIISSQLFTQVHHWATMPCAMHTFIFFFQEPHSLARSILSLLTPRLAASPTSSNTAPALERCFDTLDPLLWTIRNHHRLLQTAHVFPAAHGLASWQPHERRLWRQPRGGVCDFHLPMSSQSWASTKIHAKQHSHFPSIHSPPELATCHCCCCLFNKTRLTRDGLNLRRIFAWLLARVALFGKKSALQHRGGARQLQQMAAVLAAVTAEQTTYPLSHISNYQLVFISCGKDSFFRC